MRTIILLPVITLMIGVIGTARWNAAETDLFANEPGWNFTFGDTTEFDRQKALERLRDEIKGREDRPSGEVFKNIKVMKQVPAGRLLRIMEFGYSRSLGVNCTHCHNPKNFADEDKRQKQITREMMAMVGKINSELLSNIENLESDQPTVNCTTCHRGEVKPAINLPNGN